MPDTSHDPLGLDDDPLDQNGDDDIGDIPEHVVLVEPKVLDELNKRHSLLNQQIGRARAKPPATPLEISSVNRFQNGDRSYLAVITPEWAAYLLAVLPFSDQRNIRDDFVMVLATAMRTGKFLNNNIYGIATLREGAPDNVWDVLQQGADPDNPICWSINCHHTLRAIVVANLPQQLQVREHMVADQHEARRFYSLYDIGTPRSQADVTKVRQVNSHLKIAPVLVGKATQAATIILADFDPSHISLASRDKNLKIDLILGEYRDQVVKYQEYYDMAAKDFESEGTNHKDITRAVVMALGLVILKHEPEKAHEFLSGLATPTEYQEEEFHPAVKQCRAWLIGIRGGTSGRSQQWHMCAMIKFWNAFLTDKPISAKKMSQPNYFHDGVAGTPFGPAGSR
jgi:hypothetical protein